jgi:hypothetical protein
MDGPYAGPDVDPALQKDGVAQTQTGNDGKRLDPDKLCLPDFDIEKNEQGLPTHITCPQEQRVPVELSSHKCSYWADSDPSVCLTCPFHLAEGCPTRPGKKPPSFRLRFTHAKMAVSQRRGKMRKNKQTDKNLRAAIEGTVREVKQPFPGSKLPV